MATPNPDSTDAQLLREFAQFQSDAAFQKLTHRHVNLVFGTACRATNDRAAAEEITQNVFIALAKKAAWLQREASLAAWLHRATLLEGRQWWRAETRRRTREQTAAELETTMKTTARTEAAMSAVLDEALLELREGERQAVLLRYFEGRNHREIGTALGIGEDAARKRVDKAMDQLLASFRQRGFAIGSAALLVTFLSGATQAAPTGLTAVATKAALSAGGASMGGLGLLLARFLGLGKMQTAVICVALLAVPIAWQTKLLISTKATLAQLRSRWQELQSDQMTQKQEQEELQRQLSVAKNTLNAREAELAHRDPLAKPRPADNGQNLYRWSETSEYVRLPKSLFPHIQLTGDPRDLSTNQTQAASSSGSSKKPWSVPELSLQALGLNDVQTAAVNAAAAKLNMDFAELEQSHSTLTNQLPDGKKSGEYPALIVRSFVTEGEMLKLQLRNAWEEAMGSERTDLLWLQCNGVFHETFNNFGSRERIRILRRLEKDSEERYRNMPFIEEYNEGHMTHGVSMDDLPELFRPFVEAWQAKQQP